MELGEEGVFEPKIILRFVGVCCITFRASFFERNVITYLPWTLYISIPFDHATVVA